MSKAKTHDEQSRRWRLCLGVDDDKNPISLSTDDKRMDDALSALYGGSQKSGGRRGGLGGSAPNLARWLDDIREFFPTPVVQTIQRDAFERHNLHEMLLEPELLAVLEADVHLVANLMGLMQAIPEQTKETARGVVQKVVDELMEKLEQKTAEAVRGAIDKSRRTRRPRFNDIDWPRTIEANLQHYQKDYGTVVPERLVGASRKSRTLADLEEVVLCVDQSGSMATSVVYSSIFAAVMASLPGVDTKMVAFDTAIFDMTEMLEDPVDVLFGVQLGGGTDIDQALQYCEGIIRQPVKSHLLLITDLMEGGNVESMLARVEDFKASGTNVIVLLALSDDGKPYYDEENARRISAMGCPVFACTPDQFPDLMAVALKRGDVHEWAAGLDIALIRG